MAAVPCGSCGNKMNSEAVACPHCGVKRAGAEGGLGKVKMSEEELRAMVAIHAPGYREPRSLFKTLMWPHPRTRGAARGVEIALTIACLPLVLVGIMGMGIGRRYLKAMNDISEGGAVALMILVGGVSLVLHWGWEFFIAQSAMLSARAYIRIKANKAYDMLALADADPEPIPEARAEIRPSKPLPASPSQPMPVVAPKISAPQHTPASSALPSEGPSLLK